MTYLFYTPQSNKTKLHRKEDANDNNTVYTIDHRGPYLTK